MVSNNKSYTLKDIICIFLPIFTAAVLQYAVMLGDTLIIFLCNLVSDQRSVSSRSISTIISEAYNQPMNRAYITFAQYALFILCFGIWYYRTFCEQKLHIKLSYKSKAIILIFCGYSAQILVDCVLAIVRPVFPNIFAEYDSMIYNVTGASASWLMTLSVVILAPIGEELLFRGVIMGYAQKCLPAIGAIILQAALFGLYHGNVIQIIYAFILGIALGLIAYKLKSLVYSIILHMSVNLSIFLVPQAIYSTTQATIIACIVSAIVFISLLIYCIRQR